MSGFGQHHHTISTQDPEAQRILDQGLTLVFAFSYEEATRAFRQVVEFDAQSAMAFGGIALVLGTVKAPADAESSASRLTSQQLELLKLLAEGKTAKKVAVALRMSLKTAETHRSNVMKRLNCHSTAELVRYAVHNKIIEAYPYKDRFRFP